MRKNIKGAHFLLTQLCSFWRRSVGALRTSGSTENNSIKTSVWKSVRNVKRHAISGSDLVCGPRGLHTRVSSFAIGDIQRKELVEKVKERLLRSENGEEDGSHSGALVMEGSKLLSRIREFEQEIKEVEAIANDDESLGKEAETLVKEYSLRLRDLEMELLEQAAQQDEKDIKAAVVEVRPGAGGDESAFFADEIFSMYEKLCSILGWKWETLSKRSKDPGLREGIAIVNAVRGGASSISPYGCLKFEAGVHRVQRVPATEKAGRVHTSTAVVLVLPEAEENDVEINESEIKTESFRAGGKGGQHVNKTESAVRLTHVPTGIVVAIQDERSQHQNKSKAMMILRARVKALKEEEDQKRAHELRSSIVKTGDRSEKIRTYNFGRDQCIDHRIGVSIFGLEGLLNGSRDIEEFWDVLRTKDLVEKIENSDKPG